jgi:hypothetical protein
VQVLNTMTNMPYPPKHMSKSTALELFAPIVIFLRHFFDIRIFDAYTLGSLLTPGYPPRRQQ